jgi:hypothetical protein
MASRESVTSGQPASPRRDIGKIQIRIGRQSRSHFANSLKTTRSK